MAKTKQPKPIAACVRSIYIIEWFNCDSDEWIPQDFKERMVDALGQARIYEKEAMAEGASSMLYRVRRFEGKRK